jgi:hypothetical protein
MYDWRLEVSWVDSEGSDLVQLPVHELIVVGLPDVFWTPATHFP